MVTTPHAPFRFAGVVTACRTRRLRLCLTLCVVALGMAGRVLVEPAMAQALVVYVIPIDGVIDLGLAPFVDRTLPEAGIDSLSLNADSQLKTMQAKQRRTAVETGHAGML